jgi:hypothetical protein
VRCAFALSAAVACGCASTDFSKPVDASAQGPGGGGDAQAPDGSGVADGGARPSFCAGVTLYLPFDTGLSSTSGVAPATEGTTPLVAGKYGSGVDLLPGSNTLKYPSGYSPDRGSVLVWFKPRWLLPLAASHQIYASHTNASSGTAGPWLRFSQGEAKLHFGLNEPPPTTAIDLNQLTGTWHDVWHAAVTRWDKAGGRLRVALDRSYAAIYQGSAWVTNQPLDSFRLSANSASADATLDEVTVWSRELDDAEVTALFDANAPLSALCGF